MGQRNPRAARRREGGTDFGGSGRGSMGKASMADEGTTSAAVPGRLPRLTHEELRRAQAATLEAPRRRYGIAAPILFILLDVVYGKPLTLEKVQGPRVDRPCSLHGPGTGRLHRHHPCPCGHGYGPAHTRAGSGMHPVSQQIGVIGTPSRPRSAYVEGVSRGKLARGASGASGVFRLGGTVRSACGQRRLRRLEIVSCRTVPPASSPARSC